MLFLNIVIKNCNELYCEGAIISKERRYYGIIFIILVKHGDKGKIILAENYITTRKNFIFFQVMGSISSLSFRIISKDIDWIGVQTRWHSCMLIVCRLQYYA